MKESRRDEEGQVLTRPRMDGRTDGWTDGGGDRLHKIRNKNQTLGGFFISEAQTLHRHCGRSDDWTSRFPNDQDASQSSTKTGSQHRTV